MLNQPNTKVMMKTRVWMLAILFISFFVVSCEKEEDPIDEAKILVEYLESAEVGNYAATAMPAIKTAEHVKGLNATGAVYIIDIRAAADYAAGHIENAVNVDPKELLTHLDGMDVSMYDEISLVCYSGQTAAWATSLLRLAGYDNVYSLKFGMCAWNADFSGSWVNNVGNSHATQFTADVTEKGPAGDLPVLNTGKETGEEILAARLATIFAEGFGAAAIGKGDVFNALDNYYIVNYWPEADYLDPGHIPGAMQYTPKASMGLNESLKTLPTDKQVVVYCYTGQTSANMAAYLRVIGYDALSLKFGVNGMNYDGLDGHKWSEGAIMNYEVVTD